MDCPGATTSGRSAAHQAGVVFDSLQVVAVPGPVAIYIAGPDAHFRVGMQP
jgi:hypothetical protein